MDPTQRSDLPPELERRLRALQGLGADARAAALRQLVAEHALHAAAIAQFVGAEVSQVATGGTDSAVVRARLARLEARGVAAADRYDLQGEVARGGMGAILRAFDQDLGRPLAMKVMLRRGTEGSRTADESQLLQRFVEEAQITGQLDHPGVVPVHELGLDASGRVYFTMRLVKGITAEEVFERARRGEDGWTPTRALEVLLKVCDTLAYAHAKGVVHRDLKPSNVMVGRYGEVYVMDWGLAKVLGQPDTHDVRIRPAPSTAVSRVRTDRSVEHESDPDSPLRTMDGAIVGTPCYMAPEQAHGRVEAIGARADVYAVGAMLYTLLTGRQPYLEPGSPTSPYMVLEWVRNGPPPAVHELDRAAPAELVAICERAMARDIDARYPSMAALADDLRAFLENRVVRAYRTGARAELWSWVRRNRGMAAGLCAAMLAIVLGGAGALVYARQAERAQQDAVREQRAAHGLRAEAEDARGEAEQALAGFREEQRKKAEAEELLEQQRRREGLREQGERMQRALEEGARREQLRAAALAAVDRQLRALAAIAPSALHAAPPAVVDGFIDGLVAPVAERDELAAWRAWARARLLLSSGDLDGVEQVLQSLADRPTRDADLVGLVQRVRAEFDAAAGRWGPAIRGWLRVVEGGRWADAEAAPVARPCADVVVRAAFSGLSAPDDEALSRALARLSRRRDAGEPRWLRGVLATALGRFEDGRRDFEEDWRGFAAPDAVDATWLPMLAWNRRLAGDLAAALAIARRGLDANAEPAARGQSALEAALALVAAHRPHAALDFATVARDALPPRSIRAVEVHAALAGCQLEFRRWDEAAQSLSAAIAATPASDTAVRRRLADLIGQAQLQLGRSVDAIATFAGARVAADEVPEGLPVPSLLGLAEAAERAGRASLADAALAAAGSAATDDVQRAAVLERTLHGRFRRGEIAAAGAERAALAALLPRCGDPWVAARARVRLAEAAAGAGEPAAALAQLDGAAQAIATWLRDHARFLCEAPPLAMCELADLGDEAIGALAAIAPGLGGEHVEVVLRVLEAWRSLPARVVRSRPMRVAGAEVDGGAAERYVTERRRAIEAASRAPGPDRAAASRRRSLDELEQQLRERAPAWTGAVFPRTPRLADVQRALPSDAALVAYAVAARGAIAFVAARDVATVVPLPFAEDPAAPLRDLAVCDAAEGADRLARFGAAVLEPVLAALPAQRSPHTLFVAPPTEWSAVPFELCTVSAGGGREPLIARCDVAYVPSATACFDQLLAARRRHAVTARGALVAVRHADPDRGAAAFAWADAALAAVASAADRAEFARLDRRGTVDLDVRRPDLDVFAGQCVAEATIAAHAGTRQTLVLSLDRDGPPGAPEHAFLRCGSAGGVDLDRVDRDWADGRLTSPDLRDLGLGGAFVLLRAAAGGSDAGDVVPPWAEMERDFVAAAFSGGARVVLTAADGAPSAADRAMVAACAAACARGADPIAAFATALRRALREGIVPATGPGVRLWCVRG